MINAAVDCFASCGIIKLSKKLLALSEGNRKKCLPLVCVVT